MNRLLCGDYKRPSQFTTARPPQGQDAGSTALTRPSSAGGALWAGEVAAPEYVTCCHGSQPTPPRSQS